MTNVFVGNLSFQTTQDDLTSIFSQYGIVERVNVVTDRMTGQLRGFAFIEMASRAEAEAAISALAARGNSNQLLQNDSGLKNDAHKRATTRP
jgi:RNA recognition motif-containing protein